MERISFIRRAEASSFLASGRNAAAHGSRSRPSVGMRRIGGGRPISPDSSAPVVPSARSGSPGCARSPGHRPLVSRWRARYAKVLPDVVSRPISRHWGTAGHGPTSATCRSLPSELLQQADTLRYRTVVTHLGSLAIECSIASNSTWADQCSRHRLREYVVTEANLARCTQTDVPAYGFSDKCWMPFQSHGKPLRKPGCASSSGPVRRRSIRPIATDT